MRFEQDPRLTFETFVVGPGNRMAAAAARRAAETPGTSYNPLFVYGPAGAGKTHLLQAVGALARTLRPGLRVLSFTADDLVDRFSAAVAERGLDAVRDELLEAGLLLLDDADHLSGRPRTQEELLALWDELLRAGVQMVIAATSPPAELPDTLDELRARLAGGLTVDVAAPLEAETRLEIVRRHAEGAGVALGQGVGEALAGLPLDGPRALHAGVDRIGSVQSERGEPVGPAELSSVLGVGGAGEPAGVDEFSLFLTDIASTVEQLMEEAPWRRRLAEAILRYEGDGVRTRRLEAALEADTAPDVDRLLDGFAADVETLREIRKALSELDAGTAASPVLADPDRVAEAEAMLLSARAAAERKAQEPAAPPVDRWYFNNAEKVAWRALMLEDRLIEELG